MQITKNTNNQLIIEFDGVITRCDYYSNSVAITQPKPHQLDTIYLQYAEIAAAADWLAAVADAMESATAEDGISPR